jgi:hypothetical protein
VYGWENSSRFSHHEPCPKCGSKDNLARYEGGSGYCFGCGHYLSGNMETKTASIRHLVGGSSKQENILRSPPDDTDLGGYPESVIEWIGKYGLSVRDLIFRDVGWSKQREQLIYQFFGENDDLVLWQARNFRSGTTHKDRFFTTGSPTDVIATYYSRKSTSTACLVEDCISGICVANSGVSDGIPCFSAAMPEKKLARLAKMYKKIFIWLDGDKFTEGQKIARQLGLMGVATKVLYTKEDPKTYPMDYIEAKLT